MPGLLSRLAAAIRNRPAPPPAPERRDGALGFSAGMGSGFGFSTFTSPGNTMIAAMEAENLATVSASVQLIASTIGSLPAYVYKRDGNGRVEAQNHPVARLIRRPNERQTQNDFFEWMTASFLLRGNALAVIEADGNGQVTALIPIPWEHVIPILLPDRRLAFDVLQLGPWGGTGLPKRYLDTEVVHIRDRSDDSYLGRSRLSRAPQVLENALGLQEYATALWRNGAAPSGAIKHPMHLNDDGRAFLERKLAEKHQGAANAHRVLILDEGMSWESLGSTAEAAQCLESRRFVTEELARIMGVPLPLVNIWDHSSFTNSVTASQWMGTFTILPIVRKIEAEFLRTVFADPFGPYHLELDMSGLMRGDSVTEQSANVANVTAGIITRNEARRDLGLNPLAEPAGEVVEEATP